MKTAWDVLPGSGAAASCVNQENRCRAQIKYVRNVRVNATSTAAPTAETHQRLAHADQYGEGRPRDPLRQSFLAKSIWSQPRDGHVSRLDHGVWLPCFHAARCAHRTKQAASRTHAGIAQPAREEPGVLVSSSRSGRARSMSCRRPLGVGQPLIRTGGNGAAARNTGSASPRGPRALFCTRSPTIPLTAAPRKSLVAL